MTPAVDFFSATYAEARQRFLNAATEGAWHIESFPVDAVGAQGETLAIDMALKTPSATDHGADTTGLLLITSATHGVEGHCGSGCQLALMADEALLAWAAHTRVAVLLVHAINPYGFSWSSRTNEDNIDLNRNGHAFGQAPLPHNSAYADLHPLLLPSQWPPTAANRQAIEHFTAQHGSVGYRDAVSRGQYSHPSGLFYGGQQCSRSRDVLDHILRQHACRFDKIAWIDIHTGLGPRGHGEKIFAGRRNMAEVARAQQWWGLDLAVPFAGSSTSADITGHLASIIYPACPHAEITPLALEFGTVPFNTMVDALRGEAWLRSHAQASDELAHDIRQAVRDAFYCDQDDWKGMVLGQSRVAILQALHGLTHT